MKLFVDVAKLEAEGIVSAEQGAQIRRIAAADTSVLAVNVIAVIGAFAFIAGFLAMRPTSVQVAVLGFGLTVTGALIRKYRQAQLGFLGSSLIVIGAVLLAAGLVLQCSNPGASGLLFTCPDTPKWYGHAIIFLIAGAWLLAVGVLAQNGLLVVLSVFALAGALGSSTGYWHASYGLLVREATVTIAAFGLLGALASYLSIQVLSEPYARLARLFALMALLWVNFGFWVGSLWGDYPLESWLAPDLAFQPYSPDTWAALQAWKAQAFFISRDVFSLLWALALAGVGAWGAMTNRRGAVNMAATFAGIHFYTQWFERLNVSPAAVMAAGIIAVAIAFALWRYNQGRRAPA